MAPPTLRSRAGGQLPTTPWGYPGDQATTFAGSPSQQWQNVPELRWPDKLAVFDMMRRDPMVGSVELAISTPILRTGWHLGDDAVDPEIARFVATELGLDDPETGRVPRRGVGVAWRTLLGEMLLALRYGHMVHEFVFEMHGPRIGFARIAPRHPRSIDAWWTDTAGNVLGVSQSVPVKSGQLVPGPSDIGTPGTVTSWEQRTIHAERLLVHTHAAEAGDHLGTSVYAGMWRPWFMKDQFQRLALVQGDRTSSGVPVIKYPAGGESDKALELARNIRSGEESGIAVPVDWEADVIALEPGMDLLPWVRWANEEIAQSSQAMMLTLGHDSGARSLGDTFADVFARSLDGVVDDIETTVTERVIRPLVELNFGPDAPYPTLVGDAIQADSSAVLTALAALVDKGIITADQPLEDATRRRLRLPKAGQVRTAAEREAPPAAPPQDRNIADAASKAIAMAEKIITKETPNAPR